MPPSHQLDVLTKQEKALQERILRMSTRRERLVRLQARLSPGAVEVQGPVVNSTIETIDRQLPFIESKLQRTQRRIARSGGAPGATSALAVTQTSSMTLGELLEQLTSREVADSVSDILEAAGRAVVNVSEFLASPEFAAGVARAAAMLSEAFELIDSLLGATPQLPQTPPVTHDYVDDPSDESFVDTVKTLTEVFVRSPPQHFSSTETSKESEGTIERTSITPFIERDLIRQSLHHVQGTYKDVAPFIVPILIWYFGPGLSPLFLVAVLFAYLIGRRLMDSAAAPPEK